MSLEFVVERDHAEASERAAELIVAAVRAGRSLGLSGSLLFASRAGDGSGGESRYGANVIFRRGRKSDVVLGLRFHDYDIGTGASAFTASVGMGF